MKNIVLYALVACVNFVINFLIYNYSFNQQATPYLHEEQRVESAIAMLSTTVPAYVVSAIVFTVSLYLLERYRSARS